MLIDTHAHLSMKEFAEDLTEVISRAQKNNVGKIISCGFDLKSSEKSLEISKKFPGVFASAGIHPHHAEETNSETLENFRKIASSSQTKAIGEIGLDYYRNIVPCDAQKNLFKSLLKIATNLNLPVIIHSRDAGDDVMAILEEFKDLKKIVFHCFPADLKLFEKVMQKDYFISFTATITFKNASPILKKIVELTPLEKMMVETDCPYLAPQNFRGKRNEPAYLIYIVEKIAEIKKLNFETVAEITTKNACNFFNI